MTARGATRNYEAAEIYVFLAIGTARTAREEVINLRVCVYARARVYVVLAWPRTLDK